MKKRIILPALLAAFALQPAPLRAGDDEAAELNEQPAAVQKTAHAQIGKNPIEEVEPAFEGGQHATEVEYSDNGKKMAIVIARDGALIQKERRMSPSDTPDAIQKSVDAFYPDATITHIKEVTRSTSTFFEISVRAAGKSHLLKLDPSGNPLKQAQ